MTRPRSLIISYVMGILRHKLDEIRRWRESTRMAKAFHAESRARMDRLAAEGRSDVALRENVRLMGIDLRAGVRPRIVSFKGHRVG